VQKNCRVLQLFLLTHAYFSPAFYGISRSDYENRNGTPRVLCFFVPGREITKFRNYYLPYSFESLTINPKPHADTEFVIVPSKEIFKRIKKLFSKK